MPQGLNFRQQVFRQREFGCNMTPLHNQMFDETLVSVYSFFSFCLPGSIITSN
jgi:hypothetical protein